MAVVVQNLDVSSCIGRKSFKWSEIGTKLHNACILVIVHEMLSTCANNISVPFWMTLPVAASQKTLLYALEKWKVGFVVKHVKIFVWQHYLASYNEHMCKVWEHFDKLCLEYGQNIGCLSWKLWMFVGDNKFLRTLFQ